MKKLTEILEGQNNKHTKRDHIFFFHQNCPESTVWCHFILPSTVMVTEVTVVQVAICSSVPIRHIFTLNTCRIWETALFPTSPIIHHSHSYLKQHVMALLKRTIGTNIFFNSPVAFELLTFSFCEEVCFHDQSAKKGILLEGDAGFKNPIPILHKRQINNSYLIFYMQSIDDVCT